MLDNLSTHITPQVKAWLDKNTHVHRTSPGWLQLDQPDRDWSGIITRQAIRRGTFASVQALIRRIRYYIGDIGHWNTSLEPFEWTATADETLATVQLVQTNIKKLFDNNAK